MVKKSHSSLLRRKPKRGKCGPVEIPARIHPHLGGNSRNEKLVDTWTLSNKLETFSRADRELKDLDSQLNRLRKKVTRLEERRNVLSNIRKDARDGIEGMLINSER